MKRSPPARTDFLMRNGWEPVPEKAVGRIPITMWRDPLHTDRPGGGRHKQVLCPRDAELLTERRLALVQSVMED